MAPNSDEANRPSAQAAPADHDRTRKVLMRREGPDRKIVVPTLRVVAGRDMLRFVTLEEDDEIGIGRDESCALVLSDASVSRRHARVTCDAGGVLRVTDLGSTNGTAVNGHPIETSELRPGDHLEIGTVSLRLDLLSLEEVAHLESVLARLEATGRDPLTRLQTRAWIDDQLPEVRRSAARVGNDMSLVFADIDNFKSVNDRYGHPVGDEVLVGVARILLIGVRETDAVVRYGGEEMLLFLQGSNEEAACEVADRIRRVVEAHDWSRTAQGLRITASFGVAGARPKETVREWIERADKALYAAKSRGRNRVVGASGLP